MILTSLELEPDAPADHGQHCGTCRRCLDACPTQAFDGPHRIDARRCISYLTIEHDGPIPHEFREAIGNRIYGCDDCLAVCPWNRFADAAAANRAFLPRAELAAPRLADLLALDDAAFREMFAGLADQADRPQPDGPQCLIAAGNSGDPALAQAVRPHAGRSRPGRRRGGALGAGSAAAFERGDAGRLIGVDAGGQAGVDVGHALEPAPPAAGRDRRRARSACARNWSLRPAPSRTWSAGLPKWPTSSDAVRPMRPVAILRRSGGDDRLGRRAAAGAVAQPARSRAKARMQTAHGSTMHAPACARQGCGPAERSARRALPDIRSFHARPRLDVLTIGNAIVDVIADATDDFLAAEGLTKGSMRLIDAEEAERLYAHMGPAREVSGGSAGNTAAGIAALGGTRRLHRPGRARPTGRILHATT